MTVDSGNYTCLVSNRHGQLRHTYDLQVFGTHDTTYQLIFNYALAKSVMSRTGFRIYKFVFFLFFLLSGITVLLTLKQLIQLDSDSTRT